LTNYYLRKEPLVACEKILGPPITGKLRATLGELWTDRNSDVESVLSQVQDLLTSFRGSKLVIHGHSLGVGNAIVTALLAAHSGKFKEIEVYILGGLSVLDPEAADHLQKMEVKVYNFMMSDDLIPGLEHYLLSIANYRRLGKTQDTLFKVR
jgi:hypothetical protein